uniref:NADH-ubiquinone oxidoreductase chain 4L n=1 Tax=Salina celebensis TaxID=1588069 RepID=A0A6G6A5V1_9HEXA|nr:NADH dehydrogenase subunit 4L [Salina celebensis]QID03182.1 NADH dehydrogenase subunit 4L [Salina celebensis]
MLELLIGFVVIFAGFWIYCSVREHLLSTLLSLEFMVLGVFIFLMLSFCSGFYYYSLFYLIMTACEGALGLSVLIMMGRTHGGDYFKSLSFLFSS